MKNYKSFLESKTTKISLNDFLEHQKELASVINYIRINDKNLYDGITYINKHAVEYETDEFTRNIIDSALDKISSVINSKFPTTWDNIYDKGYSGNKVEGDKYKATRNLNIKEIAKLVRDELKIEFEDWKFSVIKDSFSGGQSLSVKITDMPYNPYSEYADRCFKENIECNTHSPEARRINAKLYNDKFDNDLNKITKIVNQYNYDDKRCTN